MGFKYIFFFTKYNASVEIKIIDDRIENDFID